MAKALAVYIAFDYTAGPLQAALLAEGRERLGALFTVITGIISIAFVLFWPSPLGAAFAYGAGQLVLALMLTSFLPPTFLSKGAYDGGFAALAIIGLAIPLILGPRAIVFIVIFLCLHLTAIAKMLSHVLRRILSAVPRW